MAAELKENKGEGDRRFLTGRDFLVVFLIFLLGVSLQWLEADRLLLATFDTARSVLVRYWGEAISAVLEWLL